MPKFQNCWYKDTWVKQAKRITIQGEIIRVVVERRTFTSNNISLGVCTFLDDVELPSRRLARNNTEGRQSYEVERKAPNIKRNDADHQSTKTHRLILMIVVLVGCGIASLFSCEYTFVKNA